MLISASKMDKRIVIQAIGSAQDEFGAVVRTWIDVAQVWAHVYDTNSANSFVSDKQVSPVTTKMRIRWRDDITPAMRVVFRGRFYEITGVLDLSGKREFLELQTQVGLSDG